MRIDEIEQQVAAQHSARRAFPSQGPTIEQIYSGRNQVAALELQIESAKLVADQRKKLDMLNSTLGSLAEHFEKSQIVQKQREEIEDRRYRENTHLSRIAAWAGVISAILTAIGVLVQLAFR